MEFNSTNPNRGRHPERSRFSGGAKACPEPAEGDLPCIDTAPTAQTSIVRKRLTQALPRSLRRLTLDNTGAEIAEAAAVLPLLFMVLLGVFWFGQAFRIYGTISRAAQEGARAAVAPACSTCSPISPPATNALAAISNVLTTARLDPTKLSPPGTTPAAISCNGGSTSCDGSTTLICVQKDIQLSDPTKGGTGACGVSVSFQYPYQFWLPFTSLNLQRIQIPAAARVRQENQ